MAWEINGTDEFADWYGDLDRDQQDSVIATVELLAEYGPQLDRPHADRIKNSKFHNMKELRPRGAAKNCRALYIFDPRRQAILLVGGDKSGQWAQWYSTAVPQAERLYEEYLGDLEADGYLDKTD
ncbi:MAG: type II toxin-antitoxin system RelE/ParE family toxin [Acidimicrobiales bacterium]